MSPVPWCGDQILSVAAHFSSKKLDELVLDAAQHCSALQAGSYTLKTNIMLPLHLPTTHFMLGYKTFEFRMVLEIWDLLLNIK